MTGTPIGILVGLTLCQTAAAGMAHHPVPSFLLSGGQTVVASAVVTQPRYGADPTGARDASAAIQKALDEVAAARGGVVFLPAGRYRLESPIRLGYGTTLRGEWQDPDRGNAGVGTVLLACTGAGTEAGPPLIEVPAHRETGLVNLTVWYPDQRPDAIVPYPFAIGGGCATLRNITLCNAYNGIEMSTVSACVIEGIRGTVLNLGVAALNSFEFSWMRDVRFSNRYWADAAASMGGTPLTPDQRSALKAFTISHLVGLELGRIDGLAIDGFEVEDAHVPVLVRKRPDVEQHRVFGFGGVVHRFPRVRQEHGWDPWYYGMHYANLDNVPEARGEHYEFAPVPTPARTDASSFIDVTAMPYGAVGDGQADDTRAILRALAHAAALGGGTVYLPQGEYRVTAPLTVPEGVELRGPLGHGKARQFVETCSLAAYIGANTPEPERAPAVVSLEKRSGIRGFNIVFAEQSHDVDDLVPFPYAVRGLGEGIWIVDMHILNAYNGIDLASRGCDRHLVRDVWATAFHRGLCVGGGSRDGRLERVAFSYGPWAEAGRLKGIATPESRKKLPGFTARNSVHYTFGDCTGERAWGLVGFLPRVHMHFADEDGRGCRNAQFWLSMLDAAHETCLQLDHGEGIRFLGLFGTGGHDGAHNWFEVGPEFVGPLEVYAKTIQQTLIAHPIEATAGQFHVFDEISEVAERTVSASATVEGSDPRNAIDRDPRTWWEAPAGSWLQVDLGAPMTISRVAVESAGPFLNLAQNIREAELLVSSDGTQFTVAASLDARPGGQKQPNTYSWVDVPVEPVQARYVRMRVTRPGADGVVRVASFAVFADR